MKAVLLNVFFFLPNNEKFLIAVIYRTPSSSIADFFDKFKNLLSVISNLRMPLFILGDFNIDLMGCLPSSLQRIDRHVLQFLECNLSHGMSPVCFIPTRITNSSFSLIDNIFAPYTCEATFVVMGDTSDHCILMSDFRVQKIVNKENTMKRRNFSKVNMNELKSSLSDIDWSEVTNENDSNTSLDVFYRILNEKLNLHCPFRDTYRKRNSPKKPWISLPLLKSIKEKNRLYKIKMKYPSAHNVQRFKNYKNLLVKILRTSEQIYYENSVKKSD